MAKIKKGFLESCIISINLILMGKSPVEDEACETEYPPANASFRLARIKKELVKHFEDLRSEMSDLQEAHGIDTEAKDLPNPESDFSKALMELMNEEVDINNTVPLSTMDFKADGRLIENISDFIED